MNSCVLRAMRAEKSVGSASASSSALVCRLWVWPLVAAIASMAVRGTLLKTSSAARLQPEVWVWARRDSERLSFGSKFSFMSLAHSRRPARCLAISMKTFMPAHQKNDRRGADVVDAVCDRIGQLKVERRPGFLQVVAGDRDRVELRHLLGRVGEDVRD